MTVRRLVGVIALAAAVLTGCSGTHGGHGTFAGVSPQALCPDAGLRPDALIRCLSADVSRFWTGRLHRPIHEPVVADPSASAVPRACRSFLTFGTAFLCTDNRTVYLTHTAVIRDQAKFGAYLPWALATIVSHEIGHVVQQSVGQPGFDRPGDANSRRLEQQADCLSGVWAHAKVAAHKLDKAGYRLAARRELAAVSALPTPGGLGGYSEIRTHGRVNQRIAALSKGLDSGDPYRCGLVHPKT